MNRLATLMGKGDLLGRQKFFGQPSNLQLALFALRKQEIEPHQITHFCGAEEDASLFLGVDARILQVIEADGEAAQDRGVALGMSVS